MGPDSLWLVLLLLLAAIAMLVLAIRLRRWPVRLVAGATALALAMVSGFAVVNDYYGYYRSWGVLAGDLSGNVPGGYALPAVSRVARPRSPGRVVKLTLTGPLTHISRTALVYLPAQYDQPAYAHMRFPVVELMHGSPGEPVDWVGPLRLAAIADALVQRHAMGPMVLVMPSINDGSSYLDCVNTATVPDETYLVDDVRSAVLDRFRVTRQPAGWGISGYSSGGYCAANLALRDRARFGAAAVMDGYFRAQDGPAGQALGGNAAAERANSPLQIARSLSIEARPMPAFWLSAGTGDHGDYVEARAFVAALNGLEQVHLATQPGARHNFYAWSDAIPTMLAWMWQQLAPPSLRVQFPLAGAPTSVNLPPALPGPASHRHLRAEQRARVVTPTPAQLPVPVPMPRTSGTGVRAVASGTPSLSPSPTSSRAPGSVPPTATAPPPTSTRGSPSSPSA